MLARLNNRSGHVPRQFRPLDKQYRTLRRSCKRERQAEVLDTWLHVTFYCTSHIHRWLNHVPALPLVALVCKIFAKSSIQGCKRKNRCMMRRFSLIIREKGRRNWLRMRNTNNGQTSDFTDFVRAVTRNRDTTWCGLTAPDEHQQTTVGNTPQGGYPSRHECETTKAWYFPTTHVDASSSHPVMPQPCTCEVSTQS